MDSIREQPVQPDDPELDGLALEPSLEAYSLARFDDLVSRGEVIYMPSIGEIRRDKEFCFEFRFVPHLNKKPIAFSNVPKRKTGHDFNPFLNPDPAFVLSSVGKCHYLLLNKFCVCRPTLLLITRTFLPQTDALNASDLKAVWMVLEHLGPGYYAIYNCGYEAGSSQGHKHLQILPYPNKEDLTYDLFPSHAKSSIEISHSIPNVPFKHFVLRLPASTSSNDAAICHQRLLGEMRKCQAQACMGPDHNVVLTRDWICLIPRAHNGREMGAPANACGVLGLVWLSTEEERQAWEAFGLVNHLRYLCISD